MWQNFTQRIRRSFSQSANHYDILTSLHREIGRELVKKYTQLSARQILDVGTGTGYVAGKLKFFFPESRVVAIDLAEGMLDKAQEQQGGIHFLQADGQKLPFKEGQFDLLVSNLAYQWMQDLPEAFSQARSALAPKGTMGMTMFGYHTCMELFSSLEACGVPQGSLRRLPSIQEILEILGKTGFSSFKADYERIQIQFKDLWDLLAWLKAIGANELSTGVFLGPQALSQANHYYREHFPYHEGVCSTFEVIWIEAQA